MYESTELKYTKTFEEEQEERSRVATAEYYLKRFGVETKTDYGYYRNTYDILKDLGEYLIEANICKARPSLAVEAVSRITTIEEDMFTPEQVRKMTREEVKANYHKILESMKRWN